MFHLYKFLFVFLLVASAISTKSRLQNRRFSFLFPIACEGNFPLMTPLQCFAFFGKYYPHLGNYKLSMWDLNTLGHSSMELLWDRCVTPDIAKMRGRSFNGVINHVIMGGAGDFVLRAYVGHSASKVQTLSFRKYFHTQDVVVDEMEPDEGLKTVSGINYWGAKKLWKLPMRIYTAPSVYNSDMTSLHVDYNVKCNNRITVRPLLDEIVQIPDTELYIGRMYARVPTASIGRPVFFLWFALDGTQDYNWNRNAADMTGSEMCFN